MQIVFKVTGFKFTPDYFTKLLGVVHKWIGQNKVHDKTSLYCFSHIHDNSFLFSSFDNSLMEKIKNGALADPEMFYDCKCDFVFESNHIIKSVYSCASPFFVKDLNNKHLIFKEAEQHAKNTLIKKAKIAGVDLGIFDIEFIDFVKTKLIKIHDVQNKCFVSKVKLTGSDEFKKLACSVGIGSSTGAGFGYIY